MNLFRRFTKFGLIAYLIYIFIFSIVIFIFHRPVNTLETDDIFSGQYHDNRANDRALLIESGEDAISVRLNLIEQAESHIDLAYYNVMDGQVSELLLGSLLEAADRGVKVRILLDGLVHLSNFGGKVNNIFLGFHSHPNIDLKLYEPFNPLLPISWNNRLHDKMILVDNSLALTGGRNIDDRFYLEESYGDEFVQDRDVLIHFDKTSNTVSSTTSSDNTPSSVIDDMQSYYDTLWHHKYAKPKYKYVSNRKLNKGNVYINELRSQHDTFKSTFLETHFKDKDMLTTKWAEATQPTNGIRFVSNPIGRTNQDPRVLKAMLQLTAEAKKSVFIQSPYTIPSKSMRSLFSQYEIDLEMVTLFTNSNASSPNLLATSAYKNHKKDILDNGVRIYEYQGPGSTHAKTSLFDEQLSVIGTFNVDPRSSYLNTESMVIIDSKSFADTLKKEIQHNLDSSLEVGDDYNYIDNENTPPYPVPGIKNIKISIFSKLIPLIHHLL